MLHMPHLQQMRWDYKDQLRQVGLGGGGTAYYVYDASGQRVRKVCEKSPGLTEERIYLGGFEIFRRHGGAIGANTATLERETLHIMDDKHRIALVETRTLGNDPAPQQLIRYQLGNHLGSASLELDGQAQIISYEEYTPYGSTSYQAARSQTETAKRYRYTGKERDEESGLYYHGARYYAAWLGRWTAADPLEIADGINVYAYVRANSVNLTDPTGEYSWGQFGNDVVGGLKGLARGVVEPVLIVADFGQMGAALATHAIDPEKYHDVEWLSATGKRIQEGDSGLRAGLVVATAMPTGGATVLADNIATVFEKNMSPDEAQSLLVQGAVAQVASAGMGMGLSRVTGQGWTGRGSTPATASAPSAPAKVLMIGPERGAEFARAADMQSKGSNVTAVTDPKGTLSPLAKVRAAAEQLVRKGGTFSEGKLQELDPNLRFDLVEENFPQPLGNTPAGLAEAQARFSRLASGGRLKVITENPDLMEMYKSVAQERGMSSTVETTPASTVELPPYLEGKTDTVFHMEFVAPTTQ